MAIKPSQQVGCGTGVSLLIGDSAVTKRPQLSVQPMNWRSTFCCSFLDFVHQGSGPLMKGRSGLAIPHELAWVWAARPKKESLPFMKPLDGHASLSGMANMTATACERTALAAVEPPTYPLDLMRRTVGFSLRVSLLYGWCTVKGPSGNIFLLTQSTHHDKQGSGGKTQPQGKYMRLGPKCWHDSSSL
ncbi:hypothetical protein QR685DRAFT_571839 [Neurospora intermedia]|uniref:Uncharacterized protein n=1 Tax=Neurospora intermedia TaxID=5142 RepID=A0ABR3DDN5_NEUIN